MVVNYIIIYTFMVTLQYKRNKVLRARLSDKSKYVSFRGTRFLECDLVHGTHFSREISDWLSGNTTTYMADNLERTVKQVDKNHTFLDNI